MHEISPFLLSEYTQFAPYPFPVNGVNENIFAGSSRDGTWSWVARGSVLEVFSLRSKDRCSIYYFGRKSTDGILAITAVEELRSPHIGFPCLIIGLDTVSEGGFVCIFSVKTSKVISAIQLPYKVTSLEVISGSGGVTMETHALSEQLRYCFGIVAVGTEGGHVLLVDLCLDAENYSDEAAPNKGVVVSRQTSNVAKKREVAVKASQHLCLFMNDNSFSGDRFQYKAFQKILATFSSEDVIVSAMKYIRSSALLVIGFNFGGIQLWNLHNLSVMFSTQIRESQQPVVHFAFQEPENDPRNFCYVWAVSGHYQGENYRPETESVATLYALAYSKKEWIPRFGFLYKDLGSCSKRFEFAFTANTVYASHHGKNCSRLITCDVIPQGDSSGKLEADDTMRSDEWSSSEDLSLCLMAWENWPVSEESPSSSHFVLFDLNQWYQAQMPSFLRCGSSDVCSFLGMFSLKEAMNEMDNESLLAVSVVPRSLSRFTAASAADEFFYPSSLSLKINCVTAEGILQASYLGMQRQLLAHISKAGPSVLIEPKDLYQKCQMNGLLQNTHEMTGVLGKQNILVWQRETLLSMALENNMIHFIKACVQHCKSADFIQVGCSSKFLLDWIWNKVTQVKTSVDKMCHSLFDCSGDALDEAALLSLHNCKTRLKHLSDVISAILSNGGPHTQQAKQELQLRRGVIESITSYVFIILWLCDCKLLPEHNEGDEYGEDEVAYPVTLLNRTYLFRRNELRDLHDSIEEDGILLVDGLMSELGDSLGMMWETKGGTRRYPPPSLYAAVSSYLIDGPSMCQKQMLMYYLVLDMCAYLSDRQAHLVEKLMTFCVANNMSPSLSKLVQSFWHLDHQDFEAAMAVLMDPLISDTDITPAQHLRIVKTLLFQGQFQKALKYINVRSFPHSTPEQIKLHLSVLLANGLVAEAFSYQREHQNGGNVEDLLAHLFLGCQQTHSLDALLQLPLNSVESQALSNYLHNSADSRAPELLVLFHLLRSQPLEAASLNEKLANRVMGIGSKVKERAVARNALVAGFLDTLPEEQKKMAQEIDHICSHVERPQVNSLPLSTTVTSASLKCISYSDLLVKIIDKINNSTTKTDTEEFTPFKSWKPTVSTLPFLRSPFIPQSRKRKRSVSTALDYKNPEADKPSEDFYTPLKKSRVFDLSSFRLNDQNKHRSEVKKEFLSLLQTPPISRKRSLASSPKSGDRAMGIAPLSILKTKGSILRDASPVVQDRLYCKTPSVCSEESRDEEMSEENADAISKTEDPSRQRHLRFDVPSPVSPTESTKLTFSRKVTPRRPLREPDLISSSHSVSLTRRDLHSEVETKPEPSEKKIAVTSEMIPDQRYPEELSLHCSESKSSCENSESTEASDVPDDRFEKTATLPGSIENEEFEDIEVIEINTDSSCHMSEKDESNDRTIGRECSSDEESFKDLSCESTSNTSSSSSKQKEFHGDVGGRSIPDDVCMEEHESWNADETLKEPEANSVKEAAETSARPSSAPRFSPTIMSSSEKYEYFDSQVDECVDDVNYPSIYSGVAVWEENQDVYNITHSSVLTSSFSASHSTCPTQFPVRSTMSSGGLIPAIEFRSGGRPNQTFRYSSSIESDEISLSIDKITETADSTEMMGPLHQVIKRSDSRSISPSRLSTKSSIGSSSSVSSLWEIQVAAEDDQSSEVSGDMRMSVVAPESQKEQNEPIESISRMTRSRSRSHSLSPSRFSTRSSKKLTKQLKTDHIPAIEEQEQDEDRQTRRTPPRESSIFGLPESSQEHKDQKAEEDIICRTRTSRSRSGSPSRFLTKSAKVSVSDSTSDISHGSLREKKEEGAKEEEIHSVVSSTVDTIATALQRTYKDDSEMMVKEDKSSAPQFMGRSPSRSKSKSPSRNVGRSAKKAAKVSEKIQVSKAEEMKLDHGEDMQEEQHVTSSSMAGERKKELVEKDENSSVGEQAVVTRYSLRSESKSPSRISSLRSSKKSAEKLSPAKDDFDHKQEGSEKESSSKTQAGQYSPKSSEKKESQQISPYLTRSRSRSRSISPSQVIYKKPSPLKKNIPPVTREEENVDDLTAETPVSERRSVDMSLRSSKRSKRIGKSKSAIDDFDEDAKLEDAATEEVSSSEAAAKEEHIPMEAVGASFGKAESEAKILHTPVVTGSVSKTKKSSTKTASKTKTDEDPKVEEEPLPKEEKTAKKRARTGKTIDEMKFEFSEPHSPINPKILEVVSATPVTSLPPFVFSPPTTRAKMRKKKDLTETESAEMSLDVDKAHADTVRPTDASESTSKDTLSKPKSSHADQKLSEGSKSGKEPPQPDETGVINFISPLQPPTPKLRHTMPRRKAKGKKKTVKLF